MLLRQYDPRRRGRPPRSAAESRLLPWSHRPKGHTRARPPNNYPSLETDPVSIGFFIGFPDDSCLLHVLLLLDNNVYPQSKPHSLFKVLSTLNLSLYLFCVGHSILSIHHYPHVIEGAKQLRPGESILVVFETFITEYFWKRMKEPKNSTCIASPERCYFCFCVFFSRFPVVSFKLQRDIVTSRINVELVRSRYLNCRILSIFTYFIPVLILSTST